MILKAKEKEMNDLEIGLRENEANGSMIHAVRVLAKESVWIT